jgi:hemerythrin
VARKYAIREWWRRPLWFFRCAPLAMTFVEFPAARAWITMPFRLREAGMGRPRMPLADILTRIDGEHGRLSQLLGAVACICPDHAGRDDCRGCDPALARACEEALHEHLGEMLAFMTGHFRYEDGLMRDWRLIPAAPEACDDHQRDHTRISAAASRMVAELEPGNPRPGIRALHALLDHWIERHIAEHDQEMIRLLHGAARA